MSIYSPKRVCLSLFFPTHPSTDIRSSVPSAYIHSLECFISAKQEFLQGTSTTSKNLSTVYDYQHKYVTALVKQLPSGTVFPATSKSVSIHPPTTIKASPLRQGPFLLQPSPRALEGSEGGDATDITYLTFGTEPNDNEDDVADIEHLGIMLVSYQDGRVDLFLDVEKVEARWDIKQVEKFPLFLASRLIHVSDIKPRFTNACNL
jgi:nucleoporin NUP82